ncbi:MAG: sulfatase-like hydrolase/transferase, partial [Planctomycetaceae bacterium]|jgi:uncharacterized sulfatase|nr:sulfatase-like hydrolase/transferase [Planctomycetaceae bacterium]
VDGTTVKVPGLLPDVLTSEAIRWISREDPRPFLLSLHYRAPHSPWLPVAEEDWEPFAGLDPTLPHPDYPNLDTRRVKRMTREYLASMKSVDRNVGRLLAVLRSHGLERETVVIYSSDHGYNMGHNGIFHKGNGHWVLKNPPPAVPNIPRGQRPNMYDHSLRVPTAIRWPGVVRSGLTLDQTISNLDFFPTILAIAGVSLPPGTQQRGRSFLPLLKGEQMEWQNDLFAQYDTKHQSRTSMRMYRTRRWKLVRDFLNPGRDEMFDLRKDPGETSNLLKKSTPAVQMIRDRLSDKLVARMRAIKDPALSRQPAGKPKKQTRSTR